MWLMPALEILTFPRLERMEVPSNTYHLYTGRPDSAFHGLYCQAIVLLLKYSSKNSLLPTFVRNKIIQKITSRGMRKN